MGKIADMMGGLPMNELIAQPLTSVVSAQRDLAQTMIAYVNEVGFDRSEDPKSTSARMLKFDMTKPVLTDEGVSTTDVSFQAPVLGLLPMPALLVDHVTIDFQMEVSASESSKSSSEKEGSFSASGGCCWFKASVSGKVSTSKENTRSTNQSAKYQVHVEANQQPSTECMNKLLDMFAQCTEPVDVREGKKSGGAQQAA